MVPAPGLSACHPPSGPVTGSTPVVLTGTGFADGPQLAVRFGGTPATDLALIDSVSLRCLTPAGSGSVDVELINGDGQRAALPDGFAYDPDAAPTVRAFAPESGSEAGGTRLTIRGANFAPGASLRVELGAGNPATDTTFVDSNSIECTSPPGSGIVDLRVTSGDGQSAVLEGAYTYYPPWSATDLTHSTGDASDPAIFIGSIGVFYNKGDTLYGSHSDGREIELGDGYNPDGVTGPDGVEHVVWESQGRIIYASSKDDFGEKKAISSSGDSSRPSISVDSKGNVHVAWNENELGAFEILTASSRDGFQRITSVSNNADGSHAPSNAVDADDTVHVVWGGQVGGTRWDIFHASSSDDFETKTNVSSSADESRSPDCSALGSQLRVAWAQQVGASQWDVFTAGSEDAFAAQTQVTSSAEASTAPAIATHPDGTIHLVWEQADDQGGKDIFYASSESWSVLTNVSSSAEESTDPAIAVDSENTAHVAWVENIGGVKQIRYANSQGRPFTPAPILTGCAPDNANPQGGCRAMVTGKYFVRGPSLRVELGAGNFASEYIAFPPFIYFTVPPGAVGPVDVIVTNGDGRRAVLEDGFVYNPPPTITACSPDKGPESGGMPVKISGEHFVHGHSLFVMFGTELATEVVVLNPNTISCRAPKGAGIVEVRVQNGDEQEAEPLENGFSYQTPWSDPENLTRTGNVDSPSFAVDGQGVLHMAWSDDSDGPIDVVYANSNDFSARKNLSTSADDSVGPSLAVDSSGVVHIGWLERLAGGTASEIFYANSSSDWMVSNISLNSESEYGDYGPDRPSIAPLSGGGAQLVWSQWVYDENLAQFFHDVCYASSSNGWSISNVSDSAAESHVPKIASSVGGVHVVWEEWVDDANHEVFYAASPGWEKTNVSNTALYSENPELAVHGTTGVHVVWEEHSGGIDSTEVYCAGSSNGWAAVNVSRTAEQPSVGPSVAVDGDGAAHVAWEEIVEGYSNVRYAFSPSWGAQQITETADNDSSVAPLIAIDANGIVHFVWERYHGGDYDAYYRSSKAMRIAACIPDNCPKAGGSRIDVAGANLDAPTQLEVAFGEGNASGRVEGSTWGLNCDAPPGEGTVDLIVTRQGGGTATLEDGFRYTDWHGEKIVDPTSGSTYPALALDARDVPHVAWEEGGEVYYANAADGWARVNVSNTPLDSSRPSIAVGGDGKVHVAWAEWTDTGDEQIQYSNSGWDWSVKQTIGNGQAPCLAVGPYHVTHVAWSCDAGVCYANHATAWRPETIWETSGSTSPVLVVDERGVAHVAWGESVASSIPGTHAYANEEVYYANFATGWRVVNVSETLAPFEVEGETLVGSSILPSIALDGGGVAHVAWTELTHYDIDYYKPYCEIYYANASAGWTNMSVFHSDDPTNAYRAGPSLAAEKSGQLHVAWSRNGELMYAAGPPGDLVEELVYDTKLISLRPSLAVDARGVAHVAWQEGDANSRPEKLFYSDNAP
ncbi:MAG: IPT/TIG domain-containing protein [Deltaproteobacteria bacterium]|nr:IPT/TIG domain-containing protein [Deltaproteobacteria bacterium]